MGTGQERAREGIVEAVSKGFRGATFVLRQPNGHIFLWRGREVRFRNNREATALLSDLFGRRGAWKASGWEVVPATAPVDPEGFRNYVLDPSKSDWPLRAAIRQRDWSLGLASAPVVAGPEDGAREYQEDPPLALIPVAHSEYIQRKYGVQGRPLEGRSASFIKKAARAVRAGYLLDTPTAQGLHALLRCLGVPSQMKHVSNRGWTLEGLPEEMEIPKGGGRRDDGRATEEGAGKEPAGDQQGRTVVSGREAGGHPAGGGEGVPVGWVVLA